MCPCEIIGGRKSHWLRVDNVWTYLVTNTVVHFIYRQGSSDAPRDGGLSHRNTEPPDLWNRQCPRLAIPRVMADGKQHMLGFGINWTGRAPCPESAAGRPLHSLKADIVRRC